MSIENIDRDKKIDSDKKNDNYDIWNELIECVKIFETLNENEAKEYIQNNLLDDIDDIKEEFKKAFKDVPNDSKLKFETLNLLGRLGIYITKDEEEEDEEDYEDIDEIKWNDRLSPIDDIKELP